MNANINYDEIPDTSAVQEDLLAALSSQHVTVHTNEEPDFDYMVEHWERHLYGGGQESGDSRRS